MRRIENFDRKPPGTALGPGERKFDQLKNIPNSGNIDLWEEDGLSSKFKKPSKKSSKTVRKLDK